MKLLNRLVLLVAAGTALSLNASELVLNKADSSVQVDVRASPPHEFTCDLQDYEAKIEIDPVANEITSARFSFRLTDLETHNDKRNAKMQRWMDVDTFNTITWEMESVELVGGRFVAHGTFKMHGESRPVDVVFGAVMDEGRVVITGESDFNYMDFELPKIRLFIFTVNPDLHVHFELSGSLASLN